jgi:alpha-glucosidase (family GH31 glycosyl hydrolase)
MVSSLTSVRLVPSQDARVSSNDTSFSVGVDPSAHRYWNNEFQLFNNPTDGIDIDGSWIDMNEPASVCLMSQFLSQSFI